MESWRYYWVGAWVVIDCCRPTIKIGMNQIYCRLHLQHREFARRWVGLAEWFRLEKINRGSKFERKCGLAVRAVRRYPLMYWYRNFEWDPRARIDFYNIPVSEITGWPKWGCIQHLTHPSTPTPPNTTRLPHLRNSVSRLRSNGLEILVIV